MTMFKTVLDDPRLIPQSDYGIFVVYSDQTSGLIEWLIKMRTKGLVNHVMFSISPGKFVSQGNTYSEVPMERYMKKGSRLYFFRLRGLTNEQEDAIRASIRRKLAFPWYQKIYDWAGIWGQILGIKWFNIGGLNYCSEDKCENCRAILSLDMINQNEVYDFVYKMPRHEHPQGLFDYNIPYPLIMEQYGYYESITDATALQESQLK